MPSLDASARFSQRANQSPLNMVFCMLLISLLLGSRKHYACARERGPHRPELGEQNIEERIVMSHDVIDWSDICRTLVEPLPNSDTRSNPSHSALVCDSCCFCSSPRFRGTRQTGLWHFTHTDATTLDLSTRAGDLYFATADSRSPQTLKGNAFSSTFWAVMQRFAEPAGLRSSVW